MPDTDSDSNSKSISLVSWELISVGIINKIFVDGSLEKFPYDTKDADWKRQG